MIPVHFPQANTAYGPPEGMSEAHVSVIPAFAGEIKEGPFDGVRMVVVAWKPEPTDLAVLNAGGQVYLLMIGGLMPHQLMTHFPGQE